jgi:hypothetical protein
VLDVKRDLEQVRNVEPSIMKESQYYILVLIAGKSIPKRSLYLPDKYSSPMSLMTGITSKRTKKGLFFQKCLKQTTKMG